MAVAVALAVTVGKALGNELGPKIVVLIGGGRLPGAEFVGKMVIVVIAVGREVIVEKADEDIVEVGVEGGIPAAALGKSCEVMSLRLRF